MGTTSDKVIGKAKEIEGQVTGDKAREAQGVAQQLKGKLTAAASTISDTAKDIAERAKKGIEDLKH